MERTTLKLKDVGDVAVITVKYVNEQKTKFGSKLVFADATHETPLIPAETADKQLGRLGLDRQTVVGRTVEFSRAANPNGAPYWNASLVAAGTEGNRVASPYRAPSGGATGVPKLDEGFVDEGSQPDYGDEPEAPKPSNKAHAVEEAYLALWSRVAERQVAVGKALGFPVDGTSIQAATATIYISLKDRGLTP